MEQLLRKWNLTALEKVVSEVRFLLRFVNSSHYETSKETKAEACARCHSYATRAFINTQQTST